MIITQTRKRHFLALTLIFLVFCSSQAQGRYNFNDGPYIRQNGDSIEVLWIENGALNTSITACSWPYTFEKEGLPTVTIHDNISPENPFQRYTGIQKFVALSDIHGQHALFLTLLKKHNVIDQDENWNFGDGHLVVLGDIMDRGAQVTESLWFLYRLEKEAAAAGGKVHIILGNHELMVLHGDVGYIHPKYRYTSGLSQIPYPTLFSENTILGQWLRSKNITTVINDIGFVHGGFSEKVIDMESSLYTLNELFKTKVLPGDGRFQDSTSLLSLLYFDNGPLWYRGYADPEGFDETAADRILEALDIRTIVVGHTSMPKIVSVHDDKILLIDSSIKFGKSGEILVYENGSFFRGLIDGTRVPVQMETATNEQLYSSTPFGYIYNSRQTDITIVLDTDLNSLFYKNKLEESYQPATLTIYHNKEFNNKWNVRVRTRGNMRKQVSKLPPLKIDFAKSTLEGLGFTGSDKLKLVLPTKPGKSFQQKLYIEHTIYQLYQLVDSLGFRTQLVNLDLKHNGKTREEVAGFLIEDEEDYALRTNTKVIEEGVIRISALDREHYVRMCLFQYMILNTDFSVSNMHNLELVAFPGDHRFFCIPYDFDYSGMVDQDYAAPYEESPNSSVRQHFFKGVNVTHDEIQLAVDFFKPLQGAFYDIIDNAQYLDTKSKRSMKADIEEFYRHIDDTKKWKKRFINP